MDEQAANLIADHLLKGMADTLQAMLASPLQFQILETGTAIAGDVEELTDQFPVALAASMANDTGGVALLLPMAAALRLAEALQDEPVPLEDLGDAEIALLRELGEAVLGGGVARLLESLGQEFGQLKQARVLQSAEAARVLPEYLGARPGSCMLLFGESPQLKGNAALLFSAAFEDLVPAPKPAQQISPLLTEEEMQDILGGIGIPTGETISGVPPAAPEYGENLEMVLDLGVTAVARLGGIEMPIGEILALGPGSIIEVGHLVDEPVELLVNGRLIARGEVVVVDEKFGLRITEIVSPRMRIESLR